MPMRIRSPSHIWPTSCNTSTSRRPPSFRYGIIPPCPLLPLIPPLNQLSVNTGTATSRPRWLPDSNSCCYTDILVFVLSAAFRRWLLVCSLSQWSMTSLCLSLIIYSDTFKKAAHPPFSSSHFDFVTPKVSSILTICLPSFSRGLVFLMVVGWARQWYV